MKVSPIYDTSSPVHMPGAAEDLAAPVARQRRRLEQTLRALDESQWAHASRCEGWSVRDVAAHLVGVNQFWEMSVRSGGAGTPTRVLESFDPVAHPRLMVDAMGGLSSREVLDRFIDSNAGFLGALEELHARQWSIVAESPLGHVPISSLAHHALWDAWIHERDIGIPLGIPQAVEPDEVSACLRYAAAIGPALTIESSPPPGVYGVEGRDPDVRVTIEIGNGVNAAIIVRDGDAPSTAPALRGSTTYLIEALSMREPFPADAPSEWRTLASGLATIFDTELA